MTHEYNIGLGGQVERAAGVTSQAATAVAWAADRILAVGPDDVVRAISRGDSTFFDLAGAIVTALPTDVAGAVDVVARATPEEVGRGVSALLIAAGLLDPDATLEPGSAADLAFWRRPAAGMAAAVPSASGLLASVHAGVFSQGHPRRGPFEPPR